MSPPTPKRPAPNGGVQAKMAKRLTESAEMINKLTAELKETREELSVLKDHAAAQDASRRTDETRHSDELILILAELKKVSAFMSNLSKKA